VSARQREEVLNTVLAEVIIARGQNASPETIRAGGRQRPDVFLSFRGLRCAIEGKIGDVSDARNIVLSDVLGRIEAGIAQLGVGVVYPKELRTVPFERLPKTLASVELEFCLVTENSPEARWERGDVDVILGELRRAHELLSSDDSVRQAADELSGRLTEVANVFMGDEVVCKRLGDLLGMGEPPKDEDAD
jgi:hypothetical protein